MRTLLRLAAMMCFASSGWTAEALRMVGHLYLAGEGKTFPKGTKVSVFNEATKAHGEAPVDATGNLWSRAWRLARSFA